MSGKEVGKVVVKVLSKVCEGLTEVFESMGDGKKWKNVDGKSWSFGLSSVINLWRYTYGWCIWDYWKGSGHWR